MNRRTSIEDLPYRHLIAPSVATLVSALMAAVPMRDISRVMAPRSRSLLELRGLGREVWSGVDPVAYVRELREEWDR